MKTAIIGPSHPYKGGIVQQTTELAHRLSTAGHDVELIAWQSQFPKLLYPGSLLPADQPEIAVFPNTRRWLSWYNPLTWRRTGRRARGFDLVIFIWWLPTIQGPIYNVIKHYLKSTRTAVICHNVLPHEGRPGDRQLAHSFLRKVDRVIVHTDDQAAIARPLTSRAVSVVALPPLLPGWSAQAAVHQPGMRHRLLFFGIVRDYKGLDILLTALAQTQDVKLTVAGEFWGGVGTYEALIKQLGIGDRVELRPGYLPAERIPELFQAADAVVLPYRSATGTSNVQLAFGYNLPVIVSNIRALSEQVRDGVDGLVFENADASSLSVTIQKLYQPAVFEQLTASIPIPAVDASWHSYIETILQPRV